MEGLILKNAGCVTRRLPVFDILITRGPLDAAGANKAIFEGVFSDYYVFHDGAVAAVCCVPCHMASLFTMVLLYSTTPYARRSTALCTRRTDVRLDRGGSPHH